MLRLSLSTQRLAQAILLAAISVLWATNAQAEEQRCAALGANCICSEPLQAGTYTHMGDGKWDAGDSTTKECNTGGVKKAAVQRNALDVKASSDAAALAALPAGHGVARFVRANDNHEGMYYVGNNNPVDAKYVRIAARWYVYRSQTFDFQGEGTCNNSKIAQFDGGVVSDYMATSGFHLYNYLTWKPGIDCCMFGPGGNPAQPSAQFKGKWWRYEAVITNRSGPATNIQFFAKNVSDNGPEVKIADMSQDSRTNNLTPPKLMSAIMSNNHRTSHGNLCRGWIGLSHYMMAGWTSDSGQRIGAALEIQGANTPKPPPPSNLSVQ